MGKVSKALHKSGTPEPGEGRISLVKDEGPGKRAEDIPVTELRSGSQPDPCRGREKPASESPGRQDNEGAPDCSRWDERLVTAAETRSPVAESFRKLRTMILHPEQGEPPQSIMILSADPQEGKSFVCANLGISIAQGVGRKALLLDCDLRRPSLHDLFGCSNTAGISSYLDNRAELSDLVLPSGLPKLSFIPAGPPPKNPAELVDSGRMESMIQELRTRYGDRPLLFDSPPFFAASETLILSQLIDKIVLVVRWGKSGRENIKKLTEQVGRDKILGIVFNAFEMNILDRKVQGLGYTKYYADGYY